MFFGEMKFEPLLVPFNINAQKVCLRFVYGKFKNVSIFQILKSIF